jgi:hypothetical protein
MKMGSTGESGVWVHHTLWGADAAVQREVSPRWYRASHAGRTGAV